MANHKGDGMINPGYNRLAKTSNELGALIKKWQKEHINQMGINQILASCALQFVIDLKKLKEGIDG